MFFIQNRKPFPSMNGFTVVMTPEEAIDDIEGTSRTIEEQM